MNKQLKKQLKKQYLRSNKTTNWGSTKLHTLYELLDLKKQLQNNLEILNKVISYNIKHNRPKHFNVSGLTSDFRQLEYSIHELKTMINKRIKKLRNIWSTKKGDKNK